MNEQPLPFLSRLSLAIGTFFALLGDGRLAAQVQAVRHGTSAPAQPPAPAPAPAPVPPPPAAPAPSPIRQTAQVDAALQLLGLLQREARFVDFLQEDIAAYSDADVGGAARLLHGGCRKVLKDAFDLEPIRSEEEGSRITLPAGFDAAAVRVTGNVVGQPPFTGALQHKGWRATAVRLPGLTDGHDTRVIAPAEVELLSTGTTARYAIGIDLGTTHSALSWVDLQTPEAAPQILPIAQQSGPGAVQDYGLLPSFLYLPHASEFAAGDLALPWNATPDAITGEWARSHGALTPIRLVSSAKSWLGHAGVDRRAGILPADAPAEVERISPLAASTRYLQHLRDAWNHRHPDAPFDQQSVSVTIPASFDPGARELTAEAAQAAGYQGVTLLEEPQAALYSWIAGSDGAWRQQVKVGDIILVVDVGGGTSDFSLIAVVEDAGNLQLHRVAVGDHILLGGDNMDLALAHGVARELAATGKTLDPWQMRALTYACRQAKEQLLSDADLHSVPLVVPSRGSKLIGGAIKTELRRDLLATILLEGFFPPVASDARPVSRPRAGLTQIGLPYAQDAAITRHLAALLARQVGATAQLAGFAPPEGASFLHPTAVLFNGGVFKSGLLTQRVLSTLNAWLAADGAPEARLLQGADLDFAVARGAAYYGQVRQGQGIRIRGGTAQAYYVGIESSMPAVPGLEPPVQALCVAPFGMEEGSEASLPPQQLGLVVGESVRFRFFGSSVRRDDQAGTLLDFWAPEELQELAEIEATLPAEGRAVGDVVPVQLRARVTEIGTLELLAEAAGGQQWKVEFDVRENG